MNLKTFFAMAVLLPMATALAAQETPQLVKNINTAGDGILGTESVEFNGLVYFAAQDDLHGEELWVTDGTEAGTQMVKDINPGSGPSRPNGFVILGDFIFFAADDGTNGEELWKSDGTEPGTTLVKNLIAGSDDANIGFLTAFKGHIYFKAKTSGEGEELWRSDGSEPGTDLFKDINTGTPSGEPEEMTALDDFLVFRADGGDGLELWRTDGTAGGTIQVKNIDGGTGHSNPDELTRVGNRVYFQASNGSDGTEPWVTDGTNEGTQSLGDLDAADSSFPDDFVGLDGLTYFHANDGTERRLYKTDGTAGGTALVRNKDDGDDPIDIDELVVSGDLLFFEAEDEDGFFGLELWKSDGTADGTVLVRNINPDFAENSLPTHLTPVGKNRVFFEADTNAEGDEPWISDGTEMGTRLLADMHEGLSDSHPDPLIASQGRVFFSADENTGLNDELYVIAVFPPTLQNISTRGFVGLGDRVLIGGFIIGGSPKRVIVRAIGPSLGAFGIATPLFNPQVQIFSGQEMIASNDNWRDTQEDEIIDTGLAPGHDNESAIVIQLNPGPYTAIVSSPGGGTGVGLVEVFELGAAEDGAAAADGPPETDLGF